jgi:lipid II:glycine glycyltransferase (peptidoglycan interpeptide bridge formation enzyme)
LAPTASIVIDLEQELDQLLSQMHSSTRRNIKKGQQQGILIREGRREDLDLFYKLYTSTSQRQRFAPYPKAYFSKMWDLFHPLGCIQILIAESSGEAISTLLIIPFGTTVITKVVGWSGQHSEYRPNQSLFWGAIQWSKSHGYRWFDLEGIDLKTAEAILNRQPLPQNKRDSPDRFKLGFGGQVVIYPEPYEYIYNYWFRKVYNRFSPWFGNWPVAYKKLLDYIRRN